MSQFILIPHATRRIGSILFCALLTACGGGGGSAGAGGDSQTGPAPLSVNLAAANVPGVFGVVAQNERAAAGGDRITLTASKPSAADTVVWSLAAGSPGSLDRASGDTVQYIPPAANSVGDSSAVVINASIGSATKKTTIFLEGSQGLRLLAGNDFGWGRVDASGQAARFRNSGGIVRDTQGNVYVADSGNGVIRKITAQGAVTTLAGSAAARGSADGTGTAARFFWPKGLTIDAGGNLFVTDEFNHNIRKVTPAGDVTTVAGKAGVSGSTNGTGEAATFNSPSGIAIDPAGDLYVSDTGNRMIRKITPAGAVTTLAANDTNVPVESRLLSGPRGLVADASGILYVVDSAQGSFELPCGPSCYYASAAVRKITAQGVVTTLAGKHGLEKLGVTASDGTVSGGNPDAVYGARDGAGMAARFSGAMSGIAIDASGNLYVTTLGPVRKITPQGVVSTLPAGPTTNNGGPAGNWLAVDPAGKLIIASETHGIREMSFNGDIVTLAGGTVRSAGNRDGAGRSALFNLPKGIASDPSDNLYVADELNRAVRKITPNGVVTTLFAVPAGASANSLRNITTDTSGNVYVDSDHGIWKISASGAASVLPNTTGGAITTDAGGNLYAAEFFSNVIRKIPLSGTTSTITAAVPGNRFLYAQGITVDSTGNLYVVSDGVHRVTQAGAMSSVAAAPTGFSPVGITIDQQDNLYVAYSNLGETIIQKITPQGAVNTVFSHTGDGVSSGGHLYSPKGLAMAGAKTIALTVDNGVFLLRLP